MRRDTEILPGVRELDHTADLGISVRAATLPALFHRAAAGAFRLRRDVDRDAGSEPVTAHDGAAAPTLPGNVEPRVVALEAPNLPELLVKWLGELLFYAETEAVEYRDAGFDELSETRLRAMVMLEPEPRPPIRELKGVTYHGLEAARSGADWHARIIFDV